MPTGGLIAGIGDFGVTELVTQAEQAKDSAESSAGIATTKAGEASTSATTATTQAGIATTKAGEASTSATNATTQASEAFTSATTATTQAGIATTKAGEANTSATNAQSSADSASASAQTVGNVVNRELQILPVKAGSAMNIGTPVYISSADGTNIIVSPASSATEATSSKVVGLLMQTLANNGQGSVVAGGKLAGLNTSTATLGDAVWLGVNGSLIYGLANKPVAPAHLVYLGAVSRVHATLGEIIVHIQNGFEFNEIHNYLESNLQNGDVIQYNQATGLYENKKVGSENLNEQIALILSFLSASNSLYGFNIADQNGNVGLRFLEGLLSVYNAYIQNLNANTVNGVAFSSTDDYAQVLTDALGWISYKLTTDGKLTNMLVDTKDLRINSSIQIIERNGGIAIKNAVTGNDIVVIDSTGKLSITDQLSENVLTQIDQNGNVGFAINKSGKIINNSAASAKLDFKGEIEMIIGYGQSLSLGAKSVPVISTTQKYKNISFVGGARTYDNADNTNSTSSFIPLIEKISPLDSNTGESPASGMSDTIIELLKKENGIDPNSYSYSLLMCLCGNGGMSINQLSKNAPSNYIFLYNRVISSVTAAKNLAIAQNKTFNVPAVYFNQGEADVNGTTQAQYTASLLQLYSDLNADIKNASGQSNDIKMIIYQTNNHNAVGGVGNINIALAQLDATRQNTNIIMSAPTYMLDYASVDNIHLQNWSSRVNGAYHGIAYKRAVLEGKQFKPILVNRSSYVGYAAELVFDVPVLPLQLDTKMISNAGNYGFRLFNSSGVEQAVASVSIIRQDTVKIVSTSLIQSGFYIVYGMNGNVNKSGRQNGSRGNLRDSQDIALDVASWNIPLYNWCPIFKQVL